MWLLVSMLLTADIHQFPGAKEIPHDKYVQVVSEADAPIERVFVKTRDGLYVAAALRKPKGDGPFPVLIHFHGAPGGRGIDQLVGWSRGDHGSPVFERFLQEGYVTIVADYRATPLNTLAEPVADSVVTYTDDALAVVEHVRTLPYVDAERIHAYGVSLGGDVVLHLLTRTKLRAAILGAPAPIRFLGARSTAPAGAPPEDRFKSLQTDGARAERNAKAIETPVLIQVGTADSLINLDRPLHDVLQKHGKLVRMEIYEGGYHDFVIGPQGHAGRKEPLLDITLTALESALRFLKAPTN